MPADNHRDWTSGSARVNLEAGQKEQGAEQPSFNSEAKMKHHALDELRNVASVNQDNPYAAMSRTARLERWAKALEESPSRYLSTLHQTEYQPAAQRANMRADDSPISVAYKDPVLRAAGMENDTYGEAKRFFELSDEELHKVICYCHFGATVNATTAARHVRSFFAEPKPGMFDRLRNTFLD
jgi:hypothetical protein